MSIGTPYLAGHSSAGTGSASIAVPVTVAADGDGLGCLVTWNSGTIVSVSDDVSGDWTPASDEGTVNISLHAQLWVMPGAAAGSRTLTVTFSTTSGSKTVSVAGASGLDPGGAVDQAPTPTFANSASPSITSSTLAQAEELVLAGFVAAATAGAATWGSPLTALDALQGGTAQRGYLATTVTSDDGAVTASASVTSANWAMVMATWPAAPSAVAQVSEVSGTAPVPTAVAQVTRVGAAVGAPITAVAQVAAMAALTIPAAGGALHPVRVLRASGLWQAAQILTCDGSTWI